MWKLEIHLAIPKFNLAPVVLQIIILKCLNNNPSIIKHLKKAFFYVKMAIYIAAWKLEHAALLRIGLAQIGHC